MSISDGDTGKVGGLIVGGAGIGGIVAEGSNTNLLIVIGIMAVIAVVFYLFFRHHANKENSR